MVWSDLSSGRSVALPFYAPRTSRSVQRATISILKFQESKNRKVFKIWNETRKKKNRMKMNKMLSVHVSLVARPAVFLRRFNSRFAVVQFLSSSCWIIIIIQRIIIRNNKRSTKVWKKLDTEADTVVDCCRNWGEGHKQRHGQCANDRH